MNPSSISKVQFLYLLAGLLMLLSSQTAVDFRSQGFNIGQWLSGDLRPDPSPAWNRSGTKILVPGLVGNTNPSRQLFIISLPEE